MLIKKVKMFNNNFITAEVNKLLIFFVYILQINAQLLETDFSPLVSATCKSGYMAIKINFNQNFFGAIHARDFRTPACMIVGNGTKSAQLDINLFSSHKSPDYCGVLVNNKTEERSIPIAVRIHKTLELADDKFYVITCGKEGFKNASFITLQLVENDRKVHETFYGRQYTLRAQLAKQNETLGIQVKNCIAFNKRNGTVTLIDSRGCPADDTVITQFRYNPKKGYADATILSMFKFPDSTDVHFQCDIAICKGGFCKEHSCNNSTELIANSQQSRSLAKDEPVLMAATSVFVLDPGEAPLVQEVCDEGRIHPSWLLWLCIALGVLFLIMLVINICLCTAMTCACTKTEIIEKDPSIIEDYDPYRSWHGSQYGSRYSLNGHNPKHGYMSGGSTMNSTRSISSHSDHYAIVHSRPGSRYSGPSKQHRGPSSNIGSHYSAK